ncbi:MerC family mercury resistance protein [Pseudomonadota bacterium]
MGFRGEKYSSIGSVVTAAACPICFPKLAAIGALFGFSALVTYEVYFLWVAQILVLLTLVGQLYSYRQYKNSLNLASTAFFVLLFFLSLYVFGSEIWVYVALGGMVTTSLWNLGAKKLKDQRV